MSVEYDFAGDVYADIIGFPLAGVLGDVVVTGAAALYAHGMAVYNAGQRPPPTYTITDFNGVSTLQYPGLHFTEVSLGSPSARPSTTPRRRSGSPLRRQTVRPCWSWSYRTDAVGLPTVENQCVTKLQR